MHSPNTPFGFTGRRSPDATQQAALDLLGGEPLEGSGFEHETPATEFQSEWTLSPEPSQGGLR
jgi:hypothetical protein